ncbi:MAG TPA: Ldh family oxidoreductase [Planctomycetaceae bacterium]|nr:Ldh family oxidoreductase [Planctomycetaceae bacterium]
MPDIKAESLAQFAASLFVAAGVGPREAKIVSTSLIGANLRGYDSHGVMRIPFYVAAIKNGRVKPNESLRIERETPAALVCDGGWGLGQVLSRDLMERLIAKARTLGIACGTLRQAAHIGRVGEYSEMAAESGMAAIICANGHGSGQRVAPVGGKEGRLGTNPLSIGMPGGKEGPFVLDFGTSATAEGKVRVKHIAGQSVPPGWILDADGNPTTDPKKLYGTPSGTILPMGGDQAYKGFGLAFMIEMLTGGLSGGRCSHPEAPPPVGNDVLFLVIDPRHFGGERHLQSQISVLEPFVRSTPCRSGIDKITLPGDPERELMAKRQAQGIPLDEGNWGELVKLAATLGVAPPAI